MKKSSESALRPAKHPARAAATSSSSYSPTLASCLAPSSRAALRPYPIPSSGCRLAYCPFAVLPLCRIAFFWPSCLLSQPPNAQARQPRTAASRTAQPRLRHLRNFAISFRFAILPLCQLRRMTHCPFAFLAYCSFSFSPICLFSHLPFFLFFVWPPFHSAHDTICRFAKNTLCRLN